MRLSVCVRVVPIWHAPASTLAMLNQSVVIVGAGAGGLCMGMQLARAGHRDFTIVERSDGIAGTWHDNRYPGAACDVPSHLYCFSFAPNPDWRRKFAPQPEIEAYLKR